MKSGDPLFYVDGVLAGNRRVLARAITVVESALPQHQELARKILEQLASHAGEAVRLGITGVPGVGKSTFIENFGLMLLEKGHRIAVLAVDPSSTVSGGSVLADKTRMEKLSVEENAFIRPSPSGGTLGGVTKKTRETLILCEAAGFDVLIVETMGVGQSEIAVASMVDFFLVLMLAGAGDELQGIKKGVLEIADALAINKADGDNIERAEKARIDYEYALNLFCSTSAVWRPPVLTCSALEMTGLDKIWETIEQHKKIMIASGELQVKRKRQAVDWMWSLIEYGLKERFNQNSEVKQSLIKITREVESGALAPSSGAKRLLSFMDSK